MNAILELNKGKILKLNKGWEPQQWLSLRDAANLWFRGEIIRHFRPVDEQFVFNAGFCPRTGRRNTWSVASVIVANSTYRQTVSKRPSRRGIFRRDHNMCLYCGETFDDANLTVDHVYPASRGGDYTWTNLVAACRLCNARKDNSSSPEAAGMKLLAVPYQPNLAEYLYLQNTRRITGDQMAFLKQYFRDENRLLN